MRRALSLALLLAGCNAHVLDGDTIALANGERIRLNGIDAPEMAGHCRPGRSCVPGDPVRSQATLTAMIEAGPITLQRLKTDRYGRTVANVYTRNGYNASCLQVRLGMAEYRADWDEGKTVARDCGYD